MRQRIITVITAFGEWNSDPELSFLNHYLSSALCKKTDDPAAVISNEVGTDNIKGRDLEPGDSDDSIRILKHVPDQPGWALNGIHNRIRIIE